MKISAIITSLLLITLITPRLYAQLKDIDKRIENKVKRKIDQKADRVIDKTINKGETQIDDRIKGDNKQKTEKSGNTVTAEFSPDSKFDFIAGENILFYDDFDMDAKGDFPIKWNTNGSGEVVNIKGTESKWLKVPDNTLSFPEIKTALPENFTVEFDLYYFSNITRPPVTFGFTETKNPAKESIKHKKIFYFRISQTIGDHISYSTSLYSGRETTHSWPANKMAGKIIHVSIAVNKERIRLYMDENKIFDLPKAFEPGALRNNFHFRSAELLPKPMEGFYVSNVRIAASGLDARSQLIRKGKYSTTGIYFNSASAKIKRESQGIIKEIADIIKEYPGIKINIIGHTDNDGEDAFNKTLSKQRADAVKAYLGNSFGVDISNINTEGKGATQPIGTNQTAEGKAQNRRVEFIKL